MSFSDPLAAQLDDPAFWARYLFFQDDGTDEDDDLLDEEDPLEDGEECVARFGLGAGYGLVLDIELDIVHDLGVTAPGLDGPAQVGWDDEAHFHPHVFRWEELDLVCRALAFVDPEMPHPGPALALLGKFVVISDHDDLDPITPLMDAAFRRLRPAKAAGGTWPRTRDWLERQDLRGSGVIWARDATGHWSVGQPSALTGPTPPRDLYSMRAPRRDRAAEESFPFTAWAGMLAQARRILREAVAPSWRDAPGVRASLDHVVETADLTTLPELGAALRAAGCANPVILDALAPGAEPAWSCWVIELLADLDQGTFLRRHFGVSPLAAARTFRLTLTVPGGGRPAAGQELASELGRTLRDQDLGWAETAGSTMVKDVSTGAFLIESTTVEIVIRDDLAAGVAVISEIVRRQGAPTGIRLTHADAPHTEIPLT